MNVGRFGPLADLDKDRREEELFALVVAGWREVVMRYSH